MEEDNKVEKTSEDDKKKTENIHNAKSVHHTTHNQENTTNNWKTAAIIMGLAAIIFLLLWITKPDISNNTNIDKTAKDAVDLLNKNILAGKGTAVLNSASISNGLIKLDLSIEEQALVVYISNDGRYLFPQPIDLTKKAQAQSNSKTQTSQTAPTDIESLIEDDAIEGDQNASVTIIEFSDYECPYCKRFYDSAYSQIYEQYIKTGKVRFIYRDFPLAIHQYAEKAAEAAECAGEQSKYYDMFNMLFKNGISGGTESFKQYAISLSLDTEEFNQCLDSGKMADEVQKDLQDGQALGITGTPSFVIGRKLIVGAQPFDVFKQAIDAELAK